MSLCNKNWFFVTKYRRDGFTKDILADLRPILASGCTNFESDLIEFEGEDDHVHLMVNYAPKLAVSKLVNSLKGISSLMIHKKNYPNIRKKLWGGALWSPSYFAGSCGGAPISVIYMYIYQPPAPHSIEGQRKEGCAFRAYIPALNGEVLRASPIKIVGI